MSVLRLLRYILASLGTLHESIIDANAHAQNVHIATEAEHQSQSSRSNCQQLVVLLQGTSKIFFKIAASFIASSMFRYKAFACRSVLF